MLFVPAFVGLGATHWVPEAKGVLFGLTRNTTRADVARAALEGVAFQVADLLDAAANDSGLSLGELKVDGGMAGNALFLQMQADLAGRPVIQSVDSEATARAPRSSQGCRLRPVARPGRADQDAATRTGFPAAHCRSQTEHGGGRCGRRPCER